MIPLEVILWSRPFQLILKALCFIHQMPLYAYLYEVDTGCSDILTIRNIFIYRFYNYAEVQPKTDWWEN